MATKNYRLIELLGAMALGGALVAIGYELGATRQVARTTGGAAAQTGEGGPGEADAGAGEGIVAEGETPSPGGGEGREGGEGGEGGEGPDTPTAAGAPPRDLPPWMQAGESGTYSAYPPIFEAAVELSPEDAEKYPRHGLVTSAAVVLREKLELDAPIVGILRAGTRVRLDRELSFGGGCTKGWHRVYPRGWICLQAGITIGDEPPDDGIINTPKPRVDEPLPYDYWRVNHDGTPFFHRLPSFGETDRADEAAKAWIAAHGRELMPTDPAKRPPEVPAVVKEYLNSGFYVTVAGEAMKSERRFLRTLRGVFARKYQLEQREGSKFSGVVLPRGADDLPIYWVVRETGFFKREAEGSDVLVKSDKTVSRLSQHPFVRRLVVGTQNYYEDADGEMMREYAVAVARKIKRPPGVREDESWVHVDLSEQTLVAYKGDVPVFATLVSTGKEPGMTPIGVHRLQSKHIATSMRDQPVEEDAYSIEDVPWTQYFHNNVALHGAFWHGGFGLVRSHGCVNLSPSDARWLFGHTQPSLPPGWHSISPDIGGNGRGSAVVITE
ncbi:MAG: L,D-transpeptidase [Myxococcales bacterium]|nr:L,D-transpeptidase [Myxococcales bacterium]